MWSAAAAAGPRTIFQDFAFARHWASSFGRESDLAIGWQTDPPLILPLACRHGCWSLLGEGLFDYQDPIGAADADQQAATAARALDQAAGPVCITGVSASSPWSHFWQTWGLAPQPFASAPVRDASPDTLAAEHPRLERRWQSAQAELCPVSEPAARLHALDWLMDRKARSLATAGRRNVLGDLECRWLAAMVEHEPQLSELWQLRRRDQPLAGILCWVSPSLRYAYTIGYDAAAAPLSPGILALYALLRHTMREGRGFNFLTGEQAFKQRFAHRSEPLLRYQTQNGHTEP